MTEPTGHEVTNYEKQFCLEDKGEERIISGISYREEDVKEFIKLLKEETKDVGLMSYDFLRCKIDALAGEKLRGEQK